MQERQPFNFQHFFFFLAVALILGVPFALLFPVSSDKVLLTRICNGLFFGGILVTSFGAIALASNLGGFALFIYSHKKFWQVVLRKGNDGDEKKLGSYFDYLSSRKKKKEVREMIFAGLIPVIASLILSYINFA